MNRINCMSLAALASMVCAACSDPAQTMSAEMTSATAAHARTCESLQATLVDVQMSEKGLWGRLSGDIEGTLQIITGATGQAGVVELSSVSYVLDRESGDIIFGDGEQGRVPTAEGSEQNAYRYGAGGTIEGGTGVFAEVSGYWKVDGWIDRGSENTDLNHQIVLCRG